MHSTAFLPRRRSACASPTDTVLLPSPAGVGLIAVTRTSRPRDGRCGDLERDLRLVLAVQIELVRREPELARHVHDRTHLRAVGDFDIGWDARRHGRFLHVSIRAIMRNRRGAWPALHSAIVVAACAIAAAQQAPATPALTTSPAPPWVAVKPIDPPATPLPSEAASAKVTRFQLRRLWRYAQRIGPGRRCRDGASRTQQGDGPDAAEGAGTWPRRRSRCGSSCSQATRCCADRTARCGISASRRSSSGSPAAPTSPTFSRPATTTSRPRRPAIPSAPSGCTTR